MSDFKELLKIGEDKLAEVNEFLSNSKNEQVSSFLEIVERFGGPEKINQKAAEARKPENLRQRLDDCGSPYVDDIDWLQAQIEAGAFVTMTDYCESLGVDHNTLNRSNAVTLEISALQYFPWLISEARQSISENQLMPGRYIRVRNMAEQSADQGDIAATALAMQILGASYVESLDTRGTDGSNIHLGGPETITGYFGGIGQPNQHPLKWVVEFLNYYTTYGVRQVLNINPGTVLAAYLLHKLGVDNEFKISVFMGNDNPFSVLWTLLTAKLFSRADGTTSLIGFNLSNSVNNETIRQSGEIRRALGLERSVRFEHHITETYKSIVVQPYNRRHELVEIAAEVPNIAAKHEGGEPEIETTREHPSDILDYFMPKSDVENQGLMPAMEQNYLDKHHSTNLTAQALVKAGIGIVSAQNAHK